MLGWRTSPAKIWRSCSTEKTFSVPVTCPACTRLVTIAYVASVGDREIRTFHWHCPHAACAGAGTFRLHGEFLGATAGPTDFDKKK